MTKHPLFHFVVFGLLLAIVFFLLAGFPTDGEESSRIVVTDGDVNQLRAAHFRQWKREPTPEELRGLLDRYVREEVLYREALARGLDKNDMTVRRAMAQKLEFIGSSQAQGEEPTEAEMQAYFSLRQERYRQPARASFAQIYISTDDRSAAESREIALDILTRIQGRSLDQLDLETLGDPLMLDPYFRDKDERQIATLFGGTFADSLMQVPSGEWAGPLASGYGLHLVYLTEKQASFIPEWSAMQAAIRQDMEREAGEAARELFYTEILRNYDVIYQGELAKNLERTQE